MRQLLQKNGKQLNALFLQFSQACRNNCKGCYVKKAKLQGNQLSWIEFKRLFSKFFQGKGGYWANQITLAVDELSRDSNKQWNQLLFLSSILEEINNDNRDIDNRPEVHLTFNSINTLIEYEIWGCNLWKKVNLISFSNLDDLTSWTLKYLGTDINYNLLADKNFSFQKIEKAVDLGINSIYLIMPKFIENNEEAIKHYRKIVNYINNLYPAEIKEKRIIIDRCFMYGKNKQACIGGISQFNVWPDGSVSACSYQQKGATKPAKNHLEILNNIKNLQDNNSHLSCIYL